MEEYTQGFSTDVQGALASLRQQVAASPEERQAAQQRRNAAAQAYQNQLSQPIPQQGGMGAAVNEYLRRYGAGKGGVDNAQTMIGAIGQANAQEQEIALGNQGRQDAAAKFGYDAAQKDLSEINMNTKTLGSMFRTTGALKPPTPEQLRTVYNAALNTAAQTAKEGDFESPDARMQWVKEQANIAVQNYVTMFATQPTGPRGETKPAGNKELPFGPLPAEQAPAGPRPELPAELTKAGAPIDAPSTTQDERKAIVMQEWQMNKDNADKLKDYPQSEEYQKALRNMAEARKELMNVYKFDPGTTRDVNAQPTPTLTPTPTGKNAAAAPGQGNLGGLAQVQTPVQPQTKATFKDKVQEAQKPVIGKGLGEEKLDLDKTAGVNYSLISQLDTLENIYKNPDIPEGELGPYLQSLRSGLKSLGIQVSDSTGIADMARAISTGLALTQRTSSGTNLLPGAISNYENKVLMQMAPTLSMTNEGRMALIKYMRLAANSAVRLNQEANKVAGESGTLPSDWFKRKQRVMLEEAAKRKIALDRIVEQYGGSAQQ